MSHLASRERFPLPMLESPSLTPSATEGIDVEMVERRGTTSTIEATQEHLQGSKIATTLSLIEIISEKERRVEQLRCELRFERKSRLVGETLVGDLLLLIERCNEAIHMSKLNTNDCGWECRMRSNVSFR